MDRFTPTPGTIPYDTDLLQAQRWSLMGLGAAMQDLLGATTVVGGALCTPVGGNMQVQVGPGRIYTYAAVDATAYGSLVADTADSTIQQGLAWGQTALTLTAPGTAGYSQIYLIEGQYQQVDNLPVVSQYYNPSNPTTALPGSNVNTRRQGLFALQAKAGTAAVSPVTPTPDAGWTPLYIVTIAYGQTAIIAGNIAVAANAPFLEAPIGRQFQTCSGNPTGQLAGTTGTVITPTTSPVFPSIAWDSTNGNLWICVSTGTTSTAAWAQIGSSGAGFYCTVASMNATTATLNTPAAMTAFAAGTRIAALASATNTGAYTITVGSFGTYAVRKAGLTGPIAPVGGEMVSGEIITLVFDGTYLQLADTALGTAAMANASSATGKVAAVNGTPTTGNLAAFADALGTVRNGPALSSAQTIVAAVSGATVVGHIPLFTDITGTLAEGPIPSSGSGTLAAVSGAVLAGHLAVFSDTVGTVIDGGAPTNGAPSVITTSQTLSPGVYAIDTSGGAITITLQATAAGVYTFLDAEATWAKNIFTLAGNGNNIGPVSTNTTTPFLCDVSDAQFSCIGLGTYWRLI